MLAAAAVVADLAQAGRQWWLVSLEARDAFGDGFEQTVAPLAVGGFEGTSRRRCGGVVVDGIVEAYLGGNQLNGASADCRLNVWR